MARWQIVVKTSEATKQTKNQNDNKKQNKKNKKQNKTKTGGGGGGWKKKKLTEWSSDVVISIDLRETERGRGLKRVLLRLYHKSFGADFYRFTSGRFGAKNREL